MKLVWLCFLSLSVSLNSTMGTSQTPSSTKGNIKVIFDTDFVIPPQDDGTALILALKSPELDILGVTTVAGNDTMQRASSDACYELELGGRSDIPVYRGANRPLVNQATDWWKTQHGKWWSDETPPMPPGGFAKKQPEKESAVDFMIRTVNANPGQVTIIAIGPLTNVATAIRQDPQFAHNVKKVQIMGGAFARYSDGGGNMTPNAEFNILVDPEAAWTVLHSGISLEFTPLNAGRKVKFTKKYYDEMVSVKTPLSDLIKQRIGPAFENDPNRRGGINDQLTVGSLVDPSLVKTTDLYVEIDINHGPDYGTTLGMPKKWEGGENAVLVPVQLEVDSDRFMQMFAERVHN
jgi:inosine-uridine nucleoside N-ribohydrolase